MDRKDSETFLELDNEDILYAIKRNDYEMAEMLMTRHLTRHLGEKKELMKLYPEFFVNNE